MVPSVNVLKLLLVEVALGVVSAAATVMGAVVSSVVMLVCSALLVMLCGVRVALIVLL